MGGEERLMYFENGRKRSPKLLIDRKRKMTHESILICSPSFFSLFKERIQDPEMIKMYCRSVPTLFVNQNRRKELKTFGSEDAKSKRIEVNGSFLQYKI